MKLVQVADIHVGAADPDVLAAAAASIREQDADALVVCGDMTQRGKREEFRVARDWVDSFSLPTIVVPGNHDTPLLDMVARVTSPFGRHDEHFEEWDDDIETDRVRITGLNTARGWQVRRNWAEGSVNLADLAACAPKGKAQNKVNILACHHPFLAPEGISMRIRTRRGLAASEWLARSRFSMLLTGHVHTPHAERCGTLEEGYLAISAGTLSRRLRLAPPGYNVLTLQPNSVDVAMMAYASGRFTEETRKTWQLKPLEQNDAPRVADL